jgi:hypothetical protein
LTLGVPLPCCLTRACSGGQLQQVLAGELN